MDERQYICNLSLLRLQQILRVMSNHLQSFEDFGPHQATCVCSAECFSFHSFLTQKWVGWLPAKGRQRPSSSSHYVFLSLSSRRINYCNDNDVLQFYLYYSALCIYRDDNPHHQQISSTPVHMYRVLLNARADIWTTQPETVSADGGFVRSATRSKCETFHDRLNISLTIQLFFVNRNTYGMQP